jgi:hypothetical protein
MAAPSQRNAEVIDAVLQAVTSEPEPADDD